MILKKILKMILKKILNKTEIAFSPYPRESKTFIYDSTYKTDRSNRKQDKNRAGQAELWSDKTGA
jgi:hypothetical protein